MDIGRVGISTFYFERQPAALVGDAAAEIEAWATSLLASPGLGL